MKDDFTKNREGLKALHPETPCETVSLYPGIEFWQLSITAEAFSVRHEHLEHVLQINYCISGQAVWKMGNGSHIYLNPGNFSLHSTKACAGSAITAPTGQYRGVTVCIDLQEASARPPEPLKDTAVFRGLEEKFCRGNTAAFLAGDEQTAGIFSAFYDQSEELRFPYQQVKVLELLLYLARTEFPSRSQLTEYKSGQIEIIREIHDRLLRQMDHRITIEELSRQYLINPTTLKTAFKSVYGTSIAAHIKEHRMAQAAKLLRESDMSIAEIAQAVGYDSQSKFSAAFKSCFRVLPREYRKH